MLLKNFAKTAAITISNILVLSLFLCLVVSLFASADFYNEYICFAVTGIIYSFVIIALEKMITVKLKISSKIYYISTTLIPMLFFNILLLISEISAKSISILEEGNAFFLIFMSIVTAVIFCAVSIIKIIILLKNKLKKD